jgi:hypothetical protein
MLERGMLHAHMVTAARVEPEPKILRVHVTEPVEAEPAEPIPAHRALIVVTAPPQLTCPKCGATVDAKCNCGVAYVPAGVRAAQAIAENPEKSNRSIAAEIGVGLGTVNRERNKATEPNGSDGKRTGRDGRRRSPRRGRQAKANHTVTATKRRTLDRVKELRVELDAAQAYIAELEAARDAETAPPLTPGPGPETEPEPVNPEPVEAEVGQPQPEAERPVALATDTVPIAPTETADDEIEPDEEVDLEPTSEEMLTNAIERVGFLLDTLFDEEIIYEVAEVDLDKRGAFFSRLRAEFNNRVDVIERMPVLDKADAIAALPELVKAYFRMHGRLSNCDVRWYMNRFPALNRNKLEDSEQRAIAGKLIRDMLQRGKLIKVKCKRDVYEIATETAPSAVEVA